MDKDLNIGDCQLMFGDCLERMKEIPDGSIDMILCDLPYGTTACKWDNIIPFEPLWAQYKRIIKDNGAIVLFGSEPFSTILRMSNLKGYKYDWIWNKEQAGNFIQAKNSPLKTTENITVFTKNGERPNYYPIMEAAKEENKRPASEKSQKSKFLGKVSNGIFKRGENYNEDLRFPKVLLTFNARQKECNNLNRVHPTQKPVALLEYLIKTYTNEGETVLDNTMGSGSTGVACVNTDRKFIGIEMDEKYYDISCKRIKDVISDKKQSLF